MIQVYKIDESGFYTDETYFVEETNEFEVATPCNTSEDNTFYKPKWNGEKWEEGWTEEEIGIWKEANKIDICSPKTTEQKLEETNQMLTQIIINQL